MVLTLTDGFKLVTNTESSTTEIKSLAIPGVKKVSIGSSRCMHVEFDSNAALHYARLATGWKGIENKLALYTNGLDVIHANGYGYLEWSIAE